MTDNSLVLHNGKVIGTKDNRVQVRITSPYACSDCHAKPVCTAYERKGKIIDAVAQEPLNNGDSVIIKMEEKFGWRALFYGFILPFILVVLVLFLLHALGSGEIETALSAIGSLVPYYMVLYLFREKIEKNFIFKAEKK
jgi:sigma-E factor negative regulatory protein RseC